MEKNNQSVIEIKEYLESRCPVCGSEGCAIDLLGTHKFSVQCQNNGLRIVLNADIFGVDQIDENHRVNAAVLHLINHYDKRHNFEYYYDEKDTSQIIDENLVNTYQLLFNYPKTFAEKIDAILNNLYMKHKSFDDEIVLERIFPAEFYCDGDMIDEEKLKIGIALEDLGYLKREIILSLPKHEEWVYKLTPKAWEKLDSILSKHQYNGFIAMSFDVKNDPLKSAIKSSIERTGHKAVVMKDLHHNNYIMPEIFYQIAQARFLVVDVSDSNLGAYYEAGYAQALGKEVIVICKRSVFHDPTKKPHFDISQKSMLIFDDEDYVKLSDMIYQRVESTVGLRW